MSVSSLISLRDYIDQAINAELSHSPARLQWFVPGTGTVFFAFSYLVPTISAMRKWLAMSAAMTVAYDVTLLAILVKDGNNRAGLGFFSFLEG